MKRNCQKKKKKFIKLVPPPLTPNACKCCRFVVHWLLSCTHVSMACTSLLFLTTAWMFVLVNLLSTIMVYLKQNFNSFLTFLPKGTSLLLRHHLVIVLSWLEYFTCLLLRWSLSTQPHSDILKVPIWLGNQFFNLCLQKMVFKDCFTFTMLMHIGSHVMWCCMAR